MRTEKDERTKHIEQSIMARGYEVFLVVLIADVFLYRMFYLKQSFQQNEDLVYAFMASVAYVAISRMRAGLQPIPIDLPYLLIRILIIGMVIEGIIGGIAGAIMLFAFIIDKLGESTVTIVVTGIVLLPLLIVLLVVWIKLLNSFDKWLGGRYHRFHEKLRNREAAIFGYDTVDKEPTT